MRPVNKIIIFVIVPLAMAGLLYLNARIAVDKYGTNTVEAGQYLAAISSVDDVITAVPGEELEHQVTIKNNGFMAWSPEGSKPIVLSYHIYNAADDTVVQEGERTPLPKTVRSGEEATVGLMVIAPNEEGKYVLEIDLVHEGVTWFADQGSKTLRLQLDIVAK